MFAKVSSQPRQCPFLDHVKVEEDIMISINDTAARGNDNFFAFCIQGRAATISDK
ncbi:MAG: hypothetical protein LQ341_006877 [Variospora aurantia]|nr:MAG: hypothetical protein LQ341_006877 [Variospora aurantia]